jgi:signal peptidase
LRRIVTPRRIWTAFSWLAVGAAAALMLSALALLAVPKLLGWQGVIVLTGSMEPALQTGGLVFVQEVHPADVSASDIISFEDSRGKTVTHRVVSVERTETGLGYKTKGDANSTVDSELVLEAALRGRVMLHLPYVGRWSDWLRQGHNFYYLLWPPAALIIAGEALNIYRQLRGRQTALASLDSISSGRLYRPNASADGTSAWGRDL